MDDEHYLKRELYERVREDARIFEFLQDGSLDGIWYWDLERPDHEWMSPRFWQTLGVDPDDKQHLASEWQDLINPDDLALAIENFRRHCEDPRHPYDQIVRYRHADGSTVWVRCRGLAIRDATGAPIRMLGAHTDVTRLKQAEAELTRRVADETSRRLVEHLPHALLIVTARGAVDFMNRAAESMLGYSRAELIEQPIELLIPPRLRGPHAALVSAFQAAPSQRRMGVGRDVVALRKDGSELPVEIGLTPIETPRGAMTVASIIDITTRKQHERAIERSNRDLERFAYVTSHDLQAPLRQVVSFARLLQENLGDGLSDESREDLAYLIDATKRMQQMIHTILDFSRLHTRSPARARVDLGEVFVEVRRALAHEIDDAGATFEVDALPTMTGDPAHFTMILQNLLANSLKFRRADVPLVIQLRMDDANGRTRLRFSDNGIGFPAEHAEEIFGMFRRLERREDYPGTGIGLAMVRRIVEEQGGRVWAESARGAGTTIVIDWPGTPPGA